MTISLMRFQDAFNVSSAYVSKSPETEDMTFRIIEAIAVRILQQDCHMCSLQELLARVQALMLFKVIQLFDGDIRQRFLAEQHFGILRAWTSHFQSRSNDLEATLHEWVVAEIVRRTIIFSLILDSLQSTLKLGYCTNVPILSILPFTPEIEL
ncbi:hypothetical protein V1509DRAFT_640646 [Lipomyces kononenkoae]